VGMIHLLSSLRRWRRSAELSFAGRPGRVLEEQIHVKG
jgi:hypothetical protein